MVLTSDRALTAKVVFAPNRVLAFEVVLASDRVTKVVLVFHRVLAVVEPVAKVALAFDGQSSVGTFAVCGAHALVPCAAVA